MYIFETRFSSGQAALEYMIIISIALVMISPLILRSQETIGNIQSAKNTVTLGSSLDTIQKGVKLVYSQGEPSKLSFDVKIPPGVVNASVQDTYIYYAIEVNGGEAPYYRFFDFNLTGELPEERGLYTISAKSEGDNVNISYRK